MKRVNWLALGLFVLAMGCGGTQEKKAALAANAKPEWVMKGSGAFPGDMGTVIYGVGVANAMPNIALQRKASDNRARQEVGETMKTEVASLTKDFMEQHTDYFRPDAAGSDELISYVSKSVSEATLINCKVVDRWDDPATGAFYSLARMDLNTAVYDKYKESVKKAIRDQAGAVIKEKANEALANLDAEIDKQRTREAAILGVGQ
ncbi:MAG: hypothetical protein A2X36_10905 [Elusimicrobia bacterium GWA2_69_24]|nr:MAG: hypothetical protein A2X36_10905 [Elusimicrobia bacterium GWA2_69_24]HBL18358.1 hypothetical protein [Elusimicrobiota bacterium]